MANFKVGDTVVCIDTIRVLGARAGTRLSNLKLGLEYLVIGLPLAACCGDQMVVLNCMPQDDGWICKCGAILPPESGGYAPWRFIKLDKVDLYPTTYGESVMDSYASVEHDLRNMQAIEDMLEQQQAALEARAEPVYKHIMANLDSDTIDGALGQISKDEYRHLEEDLGSGTMRDLSHAGSILDDIVKRYAMQLAIWEVS